MFKLSQNNQPPWAFLVHFTFDFDLLLKMYKILVTLKGRGGGSHSGFYILLCLFQHDAQMDYYGTRLATCSSDRTVKIFDVRNGGQILVADLRG